MYKKFYEYLDLSGDAQVDAFEDVKDLFINLVYAVINGEVSEEILIDFLANDVQVNEYCYHCVFDEQGNLLKPKAMLDDVELEHQSVFLEESTSSSILNISNQSGFI